MNNNISEFSIIDKSKLSSEFYFESLLEEGINKNILSNSDLERIQLECLNLLATKVESYNAGDSSSILIEKAQNIMSSNLFTIGLYLKTYGNPDNAINKIRSSSIEDLYNNGRNRINYLLSSTKLIHKKFADQIIKTRNVFYKDSLISGIEGFFKLYYPDYFAHEVHITADYPVYNYTTKLAGIEFIKNYVECGYYENLFCSHFDCNNIDYLMLGYAKNYYEVPVNIYEVVLLGAIGCVIAQKDIFALDVTSSGIVYLKNYFYNMTKEEVVDSLVKAVNVIKNMLSLSENMFCYIEESITLIAERILIGIEQNTLDKVFVLPTKEIELNKIAFNFGNKMDDKKYRNIVAEINDCISFEDKADIIKYSIRSLADLNDILLDANFSEREIHGVLEELSTEEISAIAKKYQIFDTDTIEFSDKELIFIEYIKNFISNLEIEEQKKLRKISEMIILSD